MQEDDFRTEMYADYKGRAKTPDEFHEQVSFYSWTTLDHLRTAIMS